MTGREIWSSVREATVESMTDNVPTLGAALAFYATFSLAPLLVLVVAVAGLVYGADAELTKIHACRFGSGIVPAPTSHTRVSHY
jgi:membrane protein